MQPLLAEIADVLGIIVMILFFAISMISKMLTSKPQPKGPRPPGTAGQAPQNRPSKIENQIEGFLREIRGEKPRRPPPTARVPVEAKMVPPSAKVLQAMPIEAAPVDVYNTPGHDFAGGLTRHVADHIENDSISSRNAHLGESVSFADERLEDHLHDAFDHKVGHLAQTDDVHKEIAQGTDAHSWDIQAEKKSDSAEKIRELLGSPESLRDVFVLTEILKRPEI